MVHGDLAMSQKENPLGTTGSSLFYLLPIGFLRYPFLSHTHLIIPKQIQKPGCFSALQGSKLSFSGFKQKTEAILMVNHPQKDLPAATPVKLHRAPNPAGCLKPGVRRSTKLLQRFRWLEVGCHPKKSIEVYLDILRVYFITSNHLLNEHLIY